MYKVAHVWLYRFSVNIIENFNQTLRAALIKWNLPEIEKENSKNTRKLKVSRKRKNKNVNQLPAYYRVGYIKLVYIFAFPVFLLSSHLQRDNATQIEKLLRQYFAEIKNPLSMKSLSIKTFSLETNYKKYK